MTPTVTMTPSGLGIPEPLLDTYSGALVAYSLRKLRTTYSGSAIRVRRSSDNTEQDIGFANNQLDTTALTSFVGANNGFVTAWYDQSGNGKTAFQSTTSQQPQIVTNGSIDIIGGKPSLKFITGTSSNLVTSLSVPADDYMSSFFVTRLGNGTGTGGYKYIVSIGYPGPNNNMFIVMRTGGSFIGGGWDASDALASAGGYNVGNGPKIITNGHVYNTSAETTTISSVFLGQSGTGYYVNGNSTSNKTLTQGTPDVTNTSNTLAIGSIGGINTYDGYVNEIVLYKSNQNSNRTGIESNINGFYKLY
jgi:hypothetical protein